MGLCCWFLPGICLLTVWSLLASCCLVYADLSLLFLLVDCCLVDFDIGFLLCCVVCFPDSVMDFQLWL
jgi:hypothetical protein